MGGWLRHRSGDVGVTAGATTQECTQIDQNGLSALFWGICVHCCDASCGTNCDASCVRWHERLNRHGVSVAPPRWPLPLGREDRLCASGAAARLASSPRRQPTRTPEEPILFYVPDAGLAIQVAHSITERTRKREVQSLAKLSRVQDDIRRLVIVTKEE